MEFILSWKAQDGSIKFSFVQIFFYFTQSLIGPLSILYGEGSLFRSSNFVNEVPRNQANELVE